MHLVRISPLENLQDPDEHDRTAPICDSSIARTQKPIPRIGCPGMKTCGRLPDKAAESRNPLDTNVVDANQRRFSRAINVFNLLCMYELAAQA